MSAVGVRKSEGHVSSTSQERVYAVPSSVACSGYRHTPDHGVSPVATRLKPYVSQSSLVSRVYTVTFTKKRLPGGLTRVAKMQGLKPPSRASSRLVGADRPAYDESMRSPKRKKYVRLPTPAFSRDPTVSLSHTWLPASQRLAPVRRLLGMLFFAWRVCWEMGGIESAPWLHGLPCLSQRFSSVMHPS